MGGWGDGNHFLWARARKLYVQYIHSTNHIYCDTKFFSNGLEEQTPQVTHTQKVTSDPSPTFIIIGPCASYVMYVGMIQ